MKPMTLKVLGGASIDRNMLNARALLRYLASIRIDGFNKRGLMRQRKTSDFPEMRETKDFDAALDILVELGWLRKAHSNGAGRARSDYLVNPQIGALARADFESG